MNQGSTLLGSLGISNPGFHFIVHCLVQFILHGSAEISRREARPEHRA